VHVELIADLDMLLVVSGGIKSVLLRVRQS
jgi:hypothetical protein